MLIEGKIDLMSDVSYTQARTEQMLFSSMAMGAEEYYIFTVPGNSLIRQDDPHTLDGKKIGVNKGSIQAGLYQNWAKQHGVRAELVEMTTSEGESMQMMKDGKLDAYLTLDAYGGQGNAVPVFKIGSSDFFFAVSKKRPDLLAALNGAMNQVLEENRYFNQQMSMKYISTSGANLFLDSGEQKWLSRHGAIRIGYQNNYLAFCAADEAGELTGALKEYLHQASSCFKNARLNFKPVAYPTAEAAMKALKNGEVDCMFPSNLSTADGEKLGLVMTPAMMSADIYAIVRSRDRDSFFGKEKVTVAVQEHNPNLDAVMLDHFPGWKAVRCPDMPSCFKAVSDGRADCVLISNYRYNSLAKMCEQYDLTMLVTGKNAEFYFAVNRGDNELYSILTRTTNLVRKTAVNAALNVYSSGKDTVSLGDFVRHNPVAAGAVLLALLAMLAMIINQRRLLVAEREVKESRHMVEDLNRQVFVDALTRVRNKGGFDDYISKLQSRKDQGEIPELAIGVFDCDNLKVINDRYGHDKGNVYLQSSCNLICRVFQHSPVFRIGGDEFAVVLFGGDFEKRDALMREFKEKQEAISASAQNRWEQVSVSAGIAVYDTLRDDSLKDLIRRADQLMYENKHARKIHKEL